MKCNINIFGHEAYVSDFRLPAKGRFPELFYYDIRHSDTDLGEPSTIEKDVLVNYYGTLVTTKELNFGDSDYIPLSDEQKQLIMESISGIPYSQEEVVCLSSD